ncbi:MAG: MFS transporter [Candidatus Heimdallarchaeum aukensis]|uniref:MFS transporter n=1 Tax=Candidatus Heimdallarchaeum aukensis TaxID=2876573 RepID=A0A9Y1FKV6_9ARCH|nr:MAG: MFS transporter [Candidatus Heimdallarchaeum aukensis]
MTEPIIPTEEEEIDLTLFKIMKTEETREVIPFLVSQFIGFFVLMALQQLYPLYLQKVTTKSAEQIALEWGLIVTIYTFAGIFARIPTAWLLEKYGRKLTVMTSFVLMIIGVGGLIFTTNIVLVSLLFVVLRISNNMYSLSSRLIVSDLRSKYKGLYNSLISSFGRLGNLVGTVGLGFVLNYLPPIVLLIVIVAVAIVGMIVFKLLFIEGKAELRHFTRRIDVKQGKKKTKFKFKLLTSQIFIFFSFGFALYGVIAGLTNPLFSIYGKNVLNLSESLVGTLLGLSQLSFIVISPFVGLLVSKRPNLTYYLLLIASLLTTFNLILFYFYYESVALYATFLFVKNIAQALFFPVIFTIYTFELPKEHFSLLYSISTTLFFLGYASTSYVSGVLFNISYNLPWLYASIVGVVLILTIIVATIYNSKKGEKLQ